jgi:hypothetical protein
VGKPTHPDEIRVRAASNADLALFVQLNPGAQLRAFAEVEIERRRFWKNFLTHGVPSWFALIVSVLALCVSVYVALFKHSV